MIYITGDMHGDLPRFKSKEMRKLRKNDYLIVCGDFGFVWDGSDKERKLLKWIGKRRYHVLFVEGTHDNLDLLYEYPQTEWQGGMVREISGKLRLLCRGSVFQLERLCLFTFGGGSSEDADIRREARTWWSSELPTQEEVAAAWENLRLHDCQVDYIITHQGSGRARQCLSIIEHGTSILDTFLDEVRATCKHKRWFFGGAHLDKFLPPSEVALFRKVIPIIQEKISL